MPLKTLPPTGTETADALIQLLNGRGTGDYIGEHISQLEHSLQCAHSAKRSGSDDELILAALLHDIGQFLPIEEARDVQMLMEGEGSVGRVGHEMIGEEYLKNLGFGEKVWKLVGSHVAAKRYLTAIDTSYYDGLSEASKQSLKFQGGPFQGEELEQFMRHPLSEDMVKLRKWDDRAKVVGIEGSTPRVEVYRDMMVKHLEKE
ncbi:uncharacterized protein LY89DRAFT_642787 [Mollisia scopiformis]|uniref:HD domain-containing protein n=1 Tax=Mollisia scopiformis TaxID=149040 RepID=A0A194XFC2_MOLSC|nr:uncharacterized protein LY89DRAFT_642787 [Mollisia scopiformis]KUJ18467.1 hypothetical protein LY89DRAFT_642787 [Mollisia scopiformis]